MGPRGALTLDDLKTRVLVQMAKTKRSACSADEMAHSVMDSFGLNVDGPKFNVKLRRRFRVLQADPDGTYLLRALRRRDETRLDMASAQRKVWVRCETPLSIGDCISGAILIDSAEIPLIRFTGSGRRFVVK
jgi:hypothetical protein